jgi:hypothetical protein
MPFAAPVDPYHDDESYMTVEECAKVMNKSVEEVRRLMRLQILRTHYHWGDVMVQPAAVVGYTT